MALIPVVQFVGMISTLRLVKRWETEPSPRRPQSKMWKRHILLPLLPNLLASLMLVPMLSKMRGWVELFMPDFAWLARISGGFGLIWAFLRTGIVLRSSKTK
jgi:hypothetical protein